MGVQIKTILLILAIAYTIAAIGVPLRRNELKCMIVYTVGESESVKITARLPQLPNKLEDEYYGIYIKNTQTNQQVAERSLAGVYKRELSLTANVIYEICFKVQSQRDFGRVIIQYTAENLFNIDHDEIKVPSNLLKAGDFKNAYQNTERLLSVTKKFTDLQKVRKQAQSEVFVKTTQINSRLVYISIGQIVIILAAGLYQFFSLRNFLSGKQYI